MLRVDSRVPVTVLVRQHAAHAVGSLAGAVRRRAARMLRALELEDAELSVLLCDDDAMRALNRLHRGIDRPTDVLAFAMSEGRGPRIETPLLGDVVIALPYAARQARAHGRDPLSEVTMLLAHGLLHLIGLDHRTPAEERRMKARTDALVAAAIARRQKPAVDRSRVRHRR